ncbi:MAG: hypothetical protein ABSG37_10575 [Candidatus Limnocylindrales bacterium]|jgi:hypothetical protein
MESITAVGGYGRARRPIARLVAIGVAAAVAVALMPAAAVASTAGPAVYVAIAPVRLLDTRVGNGLSAKLSANVPATFQVTGRGGIPADATAVTGNLTVVNSTAGWAVYLGPDPIAYPSSSAINFTAGEILDNGLTVALSATGTLSATYMGPAGATTDLVFDVGGYYTPDWSSQSGSCATGTGATCSAYFPLTPQRILDTRTGLGIVGGNPTKWGAGEPFTFTFTGYFRLTAVTGNVTVVNPTSPWAVYLGPDPIAHPSSSTINFLAGEILGNNVTVAVNSTPAFSGTYMGPAGATTDLVFDQTGFYADDLGAVGAKLYVPISPVRLLDTRAGNGLSANLSANVPATFQVTGRGGIPANATAVTGNLTVVNSTYPWAVYLGPDPVPSPTSSNVNFTAGEILNNGLSAELSSSGTLSATYMSTGGNTTDLVFDVTGYFIDAST